MVYQPQVSLSCNTCLAEFAKGIRGIDLVVEHILPNLLEADDKAALHYISNPGHHSFRAILKSTGQLYSIEFPPICNEGAMLGGPEREI